jgi:hypothetical protein
VPLERGDEDISPLPEGAAEPETPTLPLPSGDAEEHRECGAEVVGFTVPVASEGEGVPLPDTQLVGAPLRLSEADAQPDVEGAREELGVPLCAPLVGVAAALCVWGSEVLTEAVAQGGAEAHPDAV